MLSWPEAHGALTHFPVALLTFAAVFEIASMALRRDDLHQVGFWLLAAGAIMGIPSALAGYITVRQVFDGHIPTITKQHITGAVATLVLSLIAFAWRAAKRDRLDGGARIGPFVLLLLAAAAVSVTGYLGGRMVFSRSGDVPGDSEASAASPASASVTIPKADPAVVARGEALFHSRGNGCTNCHTMAGKGGAIGPNLTHEARRHADIAWQVAHLKAPDKVHPGSAMPSFAHLKPDELNALATYLATRR